MEDVAALGVVKVCRCVHLRRLNALFETFCSSAPRAPSAEMMHGTKRTNEEVILLLILIYYLRSYTYVRTNRIKQSIKERASGS